MSRSLISKGEMNTWLSSSSFFPLLLFSLLLRVVIVIDAFHSDRWVEKSGFDRSLSVFFLSKNSKRFFSPQTGRAKMKRRKDVSANVANESFKKLVASKVAFDDNNNSYVRKRVLSFE